MTFVAEDERLVGIDAALLQPEMNPSEGQRDRDRERDHATPRHQKVAPESTGTSMGNETLEGEVRDEMFEEFPAVGKELSAKEQLEGCA